MTLYHASKSINHELFTVVVRDDCSVNSAVKWNRPDIILSNLKLRLCGWVLRIQFSKLYASLTACRTQNSEMLPRQRIKRCVDTCKKSKLVWVCFSFINASLIILFFCWNAALSQFFSFWRVLVECYAVPFKNAALPAFNQSQSIHGGVVTWTRAFARLIGNLFY